MDAVNYVERFLHTDKPVLFETNAPMDKKHTEDFNVFSYTKRNRTLFTVSLIFGALSFLGALASAACDKHARRNAENAYDQAGEPFYCSL